MAIIFPGAIFGYSDREDARQHLPSIRNHATPYFDTYASIQQPRATMAAQGAQTPTRQSAPRAPPLSGVADVPEMQCQDSTNDPGA
jgi:hypothetical protein